MHFLILVASAFERYRSRPNPERTVRESMLQRAKINIPNATLIRKSCLLKKVILNDNKLFYWNKERAVSCEPQQQQKIMPLIGFECEIIIIIIVVFAKANACCSISVKKRVRVIHLPLIRLHLWWQRIIIRKRSLTTLLGSLLIAFESAASDVVGGVRGLLTRESTPRTSMGGMDL